MADEFDPMAVADNLRNFVASMTGLKAAFIEAGWSEAMAEQFALEALRRAE